MKNNINEKISRLVEYYHERYEESAPNFGSDECHLVVNDGISVVGLLGFRNGTLSVEWSDKLYSIENLLQVGIKFFEHHATEWGVYRTQF